jgi:hypothetical protein
MLQSRSCIILWSLIQSLKGTVSQYFRLSVLFIQKIPPGPAPDSRAKAFLNSAGFVFEKKFGFLIADFRACIHDIFVR